MVLQGPSWGQWFQVWKSFRPRTVATNQAMDSDCVGAAALKLIFHPKLFLIMKFQQLLHPLSISLALRNIMIWYLSPELSAGQVPWTMTLTFILYLCPSHYLWFNTVWTLSFSESIIHSSVIASPIISSGLQREPQLNFLTMLVPLSPAYNLKLW